MMHEGDHSILDEEHDHKHPHKQPHGHDHTHAAAPDQARTLGPRIIAAVIVGAAVVVFLVWRLI